MMGAIAQGAENLTSYGAALAGVRDTPETQEVLNDLQTYADNRTSLKNYTNNYLSTDYITDPQGLASSVGVLAGSALPSLGFGGVVGAGVKALGGRIAGSALADALADTPLGSTLGNLSSKVLLGSDTTAGRALNAIGLGTGDGITAGSIVGGTALSLAKDVGYGSMETAQNMGSIVDDMIDKGVSSDDALNTANSAALPLLATNVAQGAFTRLGLDSFGTGTGLLGAFASSGGKTIGARILQGAANAGVSALGEGSQELAQQMIQENVEGDNTGTWYNPSTWTPGEQQSFYGTFIPTLLTGGLAGAKHVAFGSPNVNQSELTTNTRDDVLASLREGGNNFGVSDAENSQLIDNAEVPVNNTQSPEGNDTINANGNANTLSTTTHPENTLYLFNLDEFSNKSEESINPAQNQSDTLSPMQNVTGIPNYEPTGIQVPGESANVIENNDNDSWNISPYKAQNNVTDKLQSVNQALEEQRASGEVQPETLQEKVRTMAEANANGIPVSDEDIGSVFADVNQGKHIIKQMSNAIKYNSDEMTDISIPIYNQNNKDAQSNQNNQTSQNAEEQTAKTDTSVNNNAVVEKAVNPEQTESNENVTNNVVSAEPVNTNKATEGTNTITAYNDNTQNQPEGNENIRRIQAVVNKYRDSMVQQTDNTTANIIISRDTSSDHDRLVSAQRQLIPFMSSTDVGTRVAVINAINKINKEARSKGLKISDTPLGDLNTTKNIRNNLNIYKAGRFKGKAQAIRANQNVIQNMDNTYTENPDLNQEMVDNVADKSLGTGTQVNSNNNVPAQEPEVEDAVYNEQNSNIANKAVTSNNNTPKFVDTQENLNENGTVQQVQEPIGQKEDKAITADESPVPDITSQSSASPLNTNISQSQPRVTTSTNNIEEPTVGGIQTVNNNNNNNNVNNSNVTPSEELDVRRPSISSRGMTEEKFTSLAKKSIPKVIANKMSRITDIIPVKWMGKNRLITPLETFIRQEIPGGKALIRQAHDAIVRDRQLKIAWKNTLRAILNPIVKDPVAVKQWEDLVKVADESKRELIQWRLMPNSNSDWVRLGPSDAFDTNIEDADDAARIAKEYQKQHYAQVSIIKDEKSGTYTVIAIKNKTSGFSRVIGDTPESKRSAFRFMQDKTLQESKAYAMKHGISEKAYDAYINTRYYLDLMHEQNASTIANYDLTGSMAQGYLTGYFPHMYDRYQVMLGDEDEDQPPVAIRSFPTKKQQKQWIKNHQADYSKTGQTLYGSERPIDPANSNEFDLESEIGQVIAPNNFTGSHTESPFKELASFLTKAFPDVANNKMITADMVTNALNNTELMEKIGVNPTTVANQIERAKNLFNTEDKASMINLVNNYGGEVLQSSRDKDRTSLSPGYNKDYASVILRYAYQTADRVSMTPFYFDATKRYLGVTGKKYNPSEPFKERKGNELHQFINGVLGYPPKADQYLIHLVNGNTLLQNTLKEHFGEDWIIHGMQNVMEFQTVMKLGNFRVSAAIAQLGQLQNVYAKIGLSKTMQAGKKVGSTDLSNTVYQKIFNDLGLDLPWVGTGFDNPMPGNTLSEKNLVNGKTVGDLLKANMSLFQKSDLFVRKVSAVAAYDNAIAEGHTSEESIEIAKDFTDETNFVYGQFNDPAIIRSFGTLGKLVGQFSRYGFHEWDFFTNHLDNKGRARLVASTMLLSGIFGVPCGNIIFGLTGLFGAGEDDIKKWILNYATQNHVPKQFVMASFYGLSSTLPGFNPDLSGSIGLQSLFNLSAKNPDEILGPTYSTAKNIIQAFTGDARADMDILAAIHAISPQITNFYQAATGNKMNWNKKQISGQYTPMERFMKGLGLRPADESLTADTNTILYENSQQIQDKKTAAINKFTMNPTADNRKDAFNLGITEKQLDKAMEKQKDYEKNGYQVQSPKKIKNTQQKELADFNNRLSNY